MIKQISTIATVFQMLLNFDFLSRLRSTYVFTQKLYSLVMKLALRDREELTKREEVAFRQRESKNRVLFPNLTLKCQSCEVLVFFFLFFVSMCARAFLNT